MLEEKPGWRGWICPHAAGSGLCCHPCSKPRAELHSLQSSLSPPQPELSELTPKALRGECGPQEDTRSQGTMRDTPAQHPPSAADLQGQVPPARQDSEPRHEGLRAPTASLLQVSTEEQNKEERQKGQMLRFPSWSTCRRRSKSRGTMEPRLVVFATVGPEGPWEQGADAQTLLPVAGLGWPSSARKGGLLVPSQRL